MEQPIAKFPRTRHIAGSRLQPGDQNLSQTSWDSLADSWLVVEEKIDGANAGISFSSDGELRLQSRGHHLEGGHQERHFALFKAWASAHREVLWRILASRYLMYGEWVYARHTLFYDALPHYFIEFDVLDRETGEFLDTQHRQALLGSGPVVSVPVLHQGYGGELPLPEAMVRRSLFKSAAWQERLREQAGSLGLDAERVLRETDASDQAEGLYVKVEGEGRVLGRLKWVRPSFASQSGASDGHWLSRPILPKLLRSGVDIFS